MEYVGRDIKGLETLTPFERAKFNSICDRIEKLHTHIVKLKRERRRLYHLARNRHRDNPRKVST